MTDEQRDQLIAMLTARRDALDARNRWPRTLAIIADLPTLERRDRLVQESVLMGFCRDASTTDDERAAYEAWLDGLFPERRPPKTQARDDQWVTAVAFAARTSTPQTAVWAMCRDGRLVAKKPAGGQWVVDWHHYQRNGIGERDAIADAAWVTIEEFARIHGVNKDTPRIWVRAGKLPFCRDGRRYLIPVNANRPPETSEPFTVADYAAHYGFSTETVRLWCCDGLLDCKRKGRQWVIPGNAAPPVSLERAPAGWMTVAEFAKEAGMTQREVGDLVANGVLDAHEYLNPAIQRGRRVVAYIAPGQMEKVA